MAGPVRAGRAVVSRPSGTPAGAGRIFVGCEGDELGLARFVELVGSAPLVFSSDFPHEVTAATCRQEIDELLENADLADADKQAVLADNAQRLYGPLGG